jgi:formylmethanofuran dehydrogenase subunit E
MEVYHNLYGLNFRKNWKPRSLEEVIKAQEIYELELPLEEQTIAERLIKECKTFRGEIVEPDYSQVKSPTIKKKKKLPSEEGYFICPSCEEEVHQDDGYYVEHLDETYCESCFNDNFYTCEGCGEYFHTDSVYTAFDQYYCESCFHDNYFHCGDCGEVESNDNGIGTHHGDIICESCYSENYSTCNTCGDVYHNDDITYAQDSGNSYCHNCVEGNGYYCYECGDFYENDIHEDVELTNEECVNLCGHCYEKYDKKGGIKHEEES